MSTQLCINITGTSAHFAEVLRSTEEVVQEYHISFTSFIEEEIKTELLSFIHANDLRREFDEISLAYWSNTYTLVPFNLIDSKNYTNAFHLCFGENYARQEIDYNMLPQLGISSIFHMPSWVKSFFIIKYPRIVIQHASSMILRGIHQKNSYKPSIEIHLNQHFFYLNVFKGGELMFSNAFEYGNTNDVIYHTLLVLQKLGISKEKGDCNLSSINKNEDLNTLINTMQQIDELKDLSLQIEVNNVTKHHMLCV